MAVLLVFLIKPYNKEPAKKHEVQQGYCHHGYEPEDGGTVSFFCFFSGFNRRIG